MSESEAQGGGYNPVPPDGCNCASFWTIRGKHKTDCPLAQPPTEPCRFAHCECMRENCTRHHRRDDLPTEAVTERRVAKGALTNETGGAKMIRDDNQGVYVDPEAVTADGLDEILVKTQNLMANRINGSDYPAMTAAEAHAAITKLMDAKFERAIGYKGTYAILATEGVKRRWYSGRQSGAKHE